MRRDNFKVKDRLQTENMKPSEDLVERYRTKEKANETVADMVMGLFGMGTDESLGTTALDMHLFGN